MTIEYPLTDKVTVYHAQNDDIDVYCEYKFSGEVSDDCEKVVYDVELIGELVITFADGLVIRMTQDQSRMLARSLGVLGNHWTDDFIDRRIKDLEYITGQSTEEQEQQEGE